MAEIKKQNCKKKLRILRKKTLRIAICKEMSFYKKCPFIDNKCFFQIFLLVKNSTDNIINQTYSLHSVFFTLHCTVGGCDAVWWFIVHFFVVSRVFCAVARELWVQCISDEVIRNFGINCNIAVACWSWCFWQSQRCCVQG